MELYKIKWKRSAESDLRAIDPQQIIKILRSVEALAYNPFPVQCRKLRGSERAYRIRVGNYRVIYKVDTKAKTVIIYHVRHRKEAYR
ncbi:type II toxin-antitoxin system RelE family toxin [Thermodesulfatator atlanticus]|uniref:type II toxin-antitoxin system RelE family toxin n=1 Tax=Thermodesulfatator atlanticus TaxID=501497 RepID=UPI0003B7A3AA|nr:type II toxin-antitoxin system RelE/ParE family toxin [Thermodesulfatator atlanticus]